jgi:serine-type D-Ala-D-Ala carboxypeptidase
MTIESIITAHLDHTFPACALCVLRDGAVLIEGAWGYIDPDTRRIPATPATLFDFASLTKLFTTTAFLSLIGDLQLELDKGLNPLVRSPLDRLDIPLAAVLPEFAALSPRPIDGGQDPHSKQPLPTPPTLVGATVDPTSVTFRHLLTHTSGLPPWRDVYKSAGDAPLPPEGADPTPRHLRWERALAALVRYPFVAPPNGIVRYSDVGLMLLGEATARLHGGDLEDAIQKRVITQLGGETVAFNPLQKGIPSSRVAPTEDDPTWRKRRVWGEVHDENACGVGGVAGHAGLFGTARALAAFGAHWLDSLTPFGIPAELRAAAITQQAHTDGTRRGLGFALRAHHDSMAGDKMSSRAFGHSGFTGTTLWIDPDARVVVALLTNSVYYGRDSAAYARTHEFRRALHDAVITM